MTYEKSRFIYQATFRASSADSAFFYYILDACDHLCFYSTLDFDQGQRCRDIKIQCTIEMKDVLLDIIKGLAKRIPLNLIFEEVVFDQ